MTKLSGLILCICIACISPYLKPYTGLGGALLALLLGGLLNPIYEKWKSPLKDGVVVTKKWVLPISIVLLGFAINAGTFIQYWKEILCLIPTIAIVFFVTLSLGKKLQIPKAETMLIAIGNSICGSAAIAATAPIIDAKENDIARSLATINLLGIVLLFGFPFLINVELLSDVLHSYIIGGTLQSVGHVGALGGILPEAEATQALAFKMCRVALLYPLCLLLLRFTAAEKQSSTKGPPWYVTGFAISMLCTTIMPTYIPALLPKTGKFLLCIAMAGIGLKINLPSIFKGSPKPLILGCISCLVMLICNTVASLLFA